MAQVDHCTWSVVEVVGHLGGEVEVLTALTSGGRGQDHVPHPPLVPLVQTLVDLVHAAEGDRGELLQRQHVHGGRHAHLPTGLAAPGQLGPVLAISEPDLDGHAVRFVVCHVLSTKTYLQINMIRSQSMPQFGFLLVLHNQDQQSRN